MCDPIVTGSIVWWGRAAWPPRPVMWIQNRSLAALTWPTAACIVPIGRRVSLCAPNTMSHGKRSNSPSSTMTRPPPPPSSAGWKMKWTVPSKLRVSARYCAAPSSIVVCPSWPQACIRPGVVDAWGNVLASVISRQSMSARSPIARADVPARSVPTTPVPAILRVTSMPHDASLSATIWLVRCSSNPSSGWACRSRRHSVRVAVAAAMRLWTGMGSPVTDQYQPMPGRGGWPA